MYFNFTIQRESFHTTVLFFTLYFRNYNQSSFEAFEQISTRTSTILLQVSTLPL